MARKELTWHERGRLWLRLGLRAVMTLIALLLLIYALPPLLSLFMPFVLASLMAWLLNPVIRFLQRKLGMSRRILAFLLVLLLFGLAGGLLFAFFYKAVTETMMLAENWQTLWESILNTVNQVRDHMSGLLSLVPEDISQTVDSLLAKLTTQLQGVLSTLFSSFAARAGNWAMGIPSFLIALVVFILGAYFILADYPHLRFVVTERLPFSLRAFLRMLRTTAGAAFGGYFRAQLMLSIGVFFILLLGFIVIGQPYGLLLAFLLAVLDFIPIVGSGTVILPWSVVCIFTGNLRQALSLLVIWGVVTLFRRVGEPKILGSQTGLSPVLSLLSIYVGMRLAGVTGMILGPVLCLVLRNIIQSGLFDGFSADLHLAVQDLDAILRNRPEKE